MTFAERIVAHLRSAGPTPHRALRATLRVVTSLSLPPSALLKPPVISPAHRMAGPQCTSCFPFPFLTDCENGKRPLLPPSYQIYPSNHSINVPSFSAISLSAVTPRPPCPQEFACRLDLPATAQSTIWARRLVWPTSISRPAQPPAAPVEHRAAWAPPPAKSDAPSAGHHSRTHRAGQPASGSSRTPGPPRTLPRLPSPSRPCRATIKVRT